MDINVLTVLLLLLGVALRVALILMVVWFIIPRRRLCPHCHADTLALVTGRLLSPLRLQRRWCPCGWSGLSRRIVRAPRPMVHRWSSEAGAPLPGGEDP